MCPIETTKPTPNQHIDSETLNTVKKRFLQVNNARLARTQSALGQRQQVFLELLPLLFHVNHPMLPGYISGQTPCGLEGYTPDRATIQRAQKLARSFTYHHQAKVETSIHSLFLMGSCGTIAQSERSDLDIWLCHSPQLTSDKKHLLKQKTTHITLWADSIGLEAHFFLMDSEKFRRGERENLSGEDCGSTQHYLLLDEFYRTGLLITGRIPIWWLIPPEQDEHYDEQSSTLRHHRFVQKNETLDFGRVGQIPAGEFVGAGVWQLYKGIDSPYKSVLKILLSEVYAHEYPYIEPLSTTFKRAIYAGQLNIDELDPYVMVFRKLERYLRERRELKRLELIRRCFYFKVGKPLTRPQAHLNKSWQRQLLERLVDEWQWSPKQLQTLDARTTWKVAKVSSEQQDIVRELINSYRSLQEFAYRSHATAIVNTQEITILGRKLYAAFERKAGKIEWINPSISDNLVEEFLTFYAINNPHTGKLSWAVIAAPPSIKESTRQQPIKQARELISLLTWSHFNGLIDGSTRLNVIENKDQHTVTQNTLHQVIRNLAQTLPKANQYTSENHEENHHYFTQAMHPTQIQLFVNIGSTSKPFQDHQRIEQLDKPIDCLAYGGRRKNLVIDIEQIQVNSWGELNTRRYEGELAIAHCLRDYLQALPSHPLPQLTAHCFSNTHAKAITSRIEQLFGDITDCYYSDTYPATTRYILSIQGQYYIVQFVDKQPQITKAGQYPALLNKLGKLQSQFSPIVIDRYCLQGSLLQLISQRAKEGVIQIFYRRKKGQAHIFISDELGSLCFLTSPATDSNSFLQPLDQFIQSTRFRQSSESIGHYTHLSPYDEASGVILEYYEMVEHHGKLQAVERQPSRTAQSNHAFNVQAIGDRSEDGQLLFSIYCDHQAFTELELGANLYQAVARFILNRRSSQERYPCYITDLDLSRCIPDQQGGIIQTQYYLQYKQRLEKALNDALQKI